MFMSVVEFSKIRPSPSQDFQPPPPHENNAPSFPTFGIFKKKQKLFMLMKV